ncbi:hypothetical protein POM88_053228 [Heracleum sosnowskyi]|uniref:Uncharacterized protein n=1 Tax=Heracleum sosnowskyi TaxID=360622 RepID=A0AAD8LXA1_9APIA|nr:hypothetical protein POM88_053228 [Heracleum sosnowskyi]
MLSGKDYMFVTLAKFEQRREIIVLKQVDKGKVMKIENIEHKMLVWDGPQNSKTSTAVTMVHHFIFFPTEMRVDKDIHAESLKNAEGGKQSMEFDATRKWYISSSYMSALVKAKYKISLNYILEDKDILKERNMSRFELVDNVGSDILIGPRIELGYRFGPTQ